MVGRLQMHSDEPRGWSRYVFEQARLEASMKVMDAGAGYGNLWRYNLERLPEVLSVTCVDLHHTHADSFYAYISEKEACGELAGRQFSFVWEDLELMKSSELFHCIFFNHVASFIQERKKLYEKFRSCLLDEGRFICTWGGYLLYENLKELLDGFLEGKDREPVERRCQKAERYLSSLETELFEVFPKVERHFYTTTLVFAAAEEFLNYLMDNDQYNMLITTHAFTKKRIDSDCFIKALKTVVSNRIKSDPESHFAKPLLAFYNEIFEYEQQLLTNINLNLFFSNVVCSAIQIIWRNK